MSQIYAWIFIVLYSGCIFQSEATRCFECTGVPKPHICTKITTCGADELCSTEQLVTISGNVIYNTGCMSSDHCIMFGKRDFSITTTSSTDIPTCAECCSGNFCNNKGCGSESVPLGQRGPYCYNCDAVLDPLACNHVAVCQTHETCMLYSPPEYNGLPETVLRSQCEIKIGCDALTLALSHNRCPPMCCGTDFCNDHCGTSSNSSTSTPVPYSSVQPASTQPANVVTTTHRVVINPHVAITTTHRATSSSTNTNSGTNQSHCEHDGYIYLHNNNAQLCVHIVTGRSISWLNAKSLCEKDGGRLVVLDTHEKALLMRQKIQTDFSDNEGYWIGAGDIHSHGQFSWVNGNHFVDQDSDWDIDQPIRSVDGLHYDCVAMWKGSREPFKWHAYHCANNLAFICEHL